ncbi:hypothetical protein NMG60_11027374 [Bertholletia excelsa]
MGEGDTGGERTEAVIQHFIHEHQLELCKKNKGDRVTCNGCEQPISGECYGCARCSFFIHLLCTELPQDLAHPFHPQHRLTLLAENPYESNAATCDACGKIIKGFVFNCSVCGFDMDVNCATLKPTTNTKILQDDENYPNRRLSHPHRLILCDNEKNFDFPLSCCNKRTGIDKGLVYVCLECHRLLHKACAESRMTIEHPFHPHHPLTLREILILSPFPNRPGAFFCNACGFRCFRSAFFCSPCGFHLDSQCSRLTPAKSNGGEGHMILPHFTHPHPLIICSKRGNFHRNCYACNLPFQEDLVNVCLECNCLLHESCADLARLIKHPLHLQHHLTLRSPSCIGNPLFDERCQACLLPIPHWKYGCGKCGFLIHSDCTSLPYIRDRRIHQHPLVYFNTATPGSFQCQAQACNKRQSPQTPFLHCVECKFNFHTNCISDSPPVVKLELHRHSLVLKNSPIKDSPDDEDDAEVYCFICEKIREFNDRSYYCPECHCQGYHLVAHVSCVVEKVLNLLEKKYVLDGRHGAPNLAASTVLLEETTDEVARGSLIIGQTEHGGANPKIDEENEAELGNMSTETQVVSTNSVSQGISTNSVMAKLDKEIIKLRIELEEETIKMEAVKRDLRMERKAVEELGAELEDLKERRLKNLKISIVERSGEKPK